ncbi:MAG: hypothetical protein J5I92_11745 [Thiogranum sp.]|nr:hypothetical protein [Thiogranum sp.]
MPEIITTAIGFFDQHAVWLVSISLACFIAGLALAPLLVIRIPADYFSHPQREPLATSARHPLIRLTLAGAKNLLGGVLVLAGLLMLVTPGQGLLTLLAGLVIMNYPGKFALERWLITRPRVLPAINWLRRRRGHPPLQAPRRQSRDAAD